MSDPKTVEIAGERVELRRPRSMAAHYDLVDALATDSRHARRVFAAALGLCWVQPPASGRNKISRRPRGVYRHDVLEYGGSVLDSLIARGVRPSAIQAAGITAYSMCAEALPSEDEPTVEEIRGNSEAPDGSTS